jgi:L-ascorbate metabolism protein UlaG (beta-lactamase superfamily)
MRQFISVRECRRKFLKRFLITSSVVAGVGTFWAAKSNSRAARLLRQLYADSRRKILPAPVKPNPAAWSDNQITICWLGHATTLINFYGLKILTDPVLGNHIGPSLGIGTLGPKRYVAPALRLDELPPIDLVLLSHAHMDHMDVATMNRLASKAPIITAKTTGDVLDGTGSKKLAEMRWGEKLVFHSGKKELQLEAFEVKHWGRRWPNGIDRGYNGYVLRREGKSLLFGGDTAQTPLFLDIKSRGPFEAAIMPIGAYNPWIWNHCTPEQAVNMANFAGAKYIVPVHHQTFKLSREPMNEPLERLQSILQNEPQRIALKQIGEHFICPRV